MFAEIKEAFDVFDYDGNGFVSAKELKTFMESVGMKTTDNEVEEMINEVDLNGEGQFSDADFRIPTIVTKGDMCKCFSFNHRAKIRNVPEVVKPNQPIDQSVNQSTNKSAKQLINKSTNHQPTKQAANQSINQATKQPSNQTNNKPIN